MGLNSRIGGEQTAWEKRNKAAERSLRKAAEQRDKIDRAKAQIEDQLNYIVRDALMYHLASRTMMEDWRQEIEAAFFSAQHDYKYFGEPRVFSMLENYLDEFHQRINRTDPVRLNRRSKRFLSS